MKNESFLLVFNTKNPNISLYVGKIFYDKSSGLPKIDAILFFIISLESTLNITNFKRTLAALIYYKQLSVTNVKCRLRYDTSQQKSRELEQICKLLTNNLSN